MKKVKKEERSSLSLDNYINTDIPNMDWEVTGVLGDIIMAQYVDTDASSEYVKRNGVLVKIDVTRQIWRVAKIILMGPECSKNLKEGDYILFPSDKGISVSRVAGYDNVVFLNEERIFGLVKDKNRNGKRQ